MQVPPDLASRLSSVALLSGRSPEAFLREAISRLIDEIVPTAGALDDAIGHALDDATGHAGFVPQPQRFSVYE
jgi:predicted transcriptional regulator